MGLEILGILFENDAFETGEMPIAHFPLKKNPYKLINVLGSFSIIFQV